MTQTEKEPAYEYVDAATGQRISVEGRKVSVQEILDITDVIQKIRRATGWGAREYLALILAFIAGGGIIASLFMWLQMLTLLAQIGGIP